MENTVMQTTTEPTRLVMDVNLAKLDKLYRMEATIQQIHARFNDFIKDVLGSDEFDRLLLTPKKTSISIHQKYLRQLMKIVTEVCEENPTIYSKEEIHGLRVFARLAILGASHSSIYFFIRYFSLKTEYTVIYPRLANVAYTYHAIETKDMGELVHKIKEDLKAIEALYSYKSKMPTDEIIKRQFSSEAFFMQKSEISTLSEFREDLTHYELLLRTPNYLSNQYGIEDYKRIIWLATRIAILKPFKGEYPLVMNFYLENSERIEALLKDRDPQGAELNVYVKEYSKELIDAALFHVSESEENAKNMELDQKMYVPCCMPYGWFGSMMLMFLAATDFKFDLDGNSKELDGGIYADTLGINPCIADIGTTDASIAVLHYIYYKHHKHVSEFKFEQLKKDPSLKNMSDKEIEKYALTATRAVMLADMTVLLDFLGATQDVEKMIADTENYVDDGAVNPLIQDSLNEYYKRNGEFENANKLEKDPMFFDLTSVQSNYS